jgi:hypothetical protein
MSFDIVIIKSARRLRSLSDWQDCDVIETLGTPEQIRDRCTAAFPGARWSTGDGLFRGVGDYVVEFSIPQDQPMPKSLHLALHFGSGWGAERKSQLLAALVNCSYRMAGSPSQCQTIQRSSISASTRSEPRCVCPTPHGNAPSRHRAIRTERSISPRGPTDLFALRIRPSHARP